jgi:hypothetical protein
VPRLKPVEGAVWRPSKWLLGLPALADERDALRWLQWAKPDLEVAYYVGESLAADRLLDGTLDALARLLLCHADQTWRVLTQPPCGHPRATVVGGGNVRLVQRRVSGRHFLHLAVRR